MSARHRRRNCGLTTGRTQQIKVAMRAARALKSHAELAKLDAESMVARKKLWGY